MAQADDLSSAAVSVLTTPEGSDKARLAGALATAWQDGRLHPGGDARPPERPARPARPKLVPPRLVPRRRIGAAAEGRIALLHAIAHIELNAIDLAADILVRFAGEDMPRAFYDDWVTVTAEEGRHFLMLSGRLAELGAAYGDLPGHDGLWQAAMETAHDLLARLAVVPLVLEARGLDVTPAMIEKLSRAGDEKSAQILGVIYREEIGHVASGKRWFDYLAARRGLEPREAWQDLVRLHFRAALKPPFNEEARSAAGLPSDFYASLT
jgi:uncharacterized ferritin-like protein (DUF455 family)